MATIPILDESTKGWAASLMVSWRACVARIGLCLLVAAGLVLRLAPRRRLSQQPLIQIGDRLFRDS